MTQQRSDQRFALTTTCQLEIDGKSHGCLVENISTVGAAVHLTDSDPTTMHVGDMGLLTVQLLTPVTYPCKIVRIDLHRVALQFIDADS